MALSPTAAVPFVLHPEGAHFSLVLGPGFLATATTATGFNGGKGDSCVESE